MSWYKSGLVFSILVLALFLGEYLKPVLQPISPDERVNFEELIPKQFGNWKIVEDQLMVIADPQIEETVSKIYSQTVSRTYVNPKGSRVMLSIAYGRSQADSMQVHKPEVCYPAQGFIVLSNQKSKLGTESYEIPVRKLVTELGSRKEFVLYWITVGDKVVDGGLDRKLQQLSYGLKGTVPGGLLFRVSTIGNEKKEAFLVQEHFIQSLLQSLSASDRENLIGYQSSFHE